VRRFAISQNELTIINGVVVVFVYNKGNRVE